MSQTNTTRYKYNPNEMAEDEFLKRFVVRQEVFDEIFEALQSADYSVPNQHHIVVGQRGQGKTTILRKISLEINKDKKLSKFLIPVQFTEEQYSMRGLCSLWERVAEHLEDNYEEMFEDALEQVEMHEEDANYEMKCFSYLEKQLKQHDKKLVLFIDNINILLESLKEQEQHHLREILLTSSSFIIVGGSTKMFEQQYEYSKPFYEFFNIIALEGLTFDESTALLKTLGDKEQTKKIEEIIEHNPARLETLRRVTGGVPRTMVMLFDIFIEDNGNTFNDLMKVLDDVTPLYQERMNHIPKVLQNITHAIAINWDGMLTKEIAKKTKLESKVVSAQLKQLEKYHIVESVSIGKNKIYSIKERFFNIWYLMRFGKKKDRNRVEWLIQFLLAWYSREELEDKAKNFILNCKTNEYNPQYVLQYTEALRYSGIDDDLESKLKQSANNFLVDAGSSLTSDLSDSNLELYKKVQLTYDSEGVEKAINILEKSGKRTSDMSNNLGALYAANNDNGKAEECYLDAIEKGNIDALNNLGMLYSDDDAYEKAEMYYLKAIKNGNTDAIFNLAHGYNKNGNYKKSEKYYLKAIELEDIDAFNNLAAQYYTQGEKMEDALRFARLAYKKRAEDPNFIYNLACIELWSENFSNSYGKFINLLKYTILILSNDKSIMTYLNLLIAKGQLYKAKEFLEIPEYQLRERYKPIWYALMTLMQDDFPPEIKKMGSELKSTVNEVLEEIEKLKVKYAL